MNIQLNNGAYSTKSALLFSGAIQLLLLLASGLSTDSGFLLYSTIITSIIYWLVALVFVKLCNKQFSKLEYYSFKYGVVLLFILVTLVINTFFK